ncbi:MAG: anion permease [Bilophila wadsworthia]|jgi:PiT family inorganic phosphate transporter|uniref:inorganic phosphate transporter n=1 Tax=Bilophila wadsworthia TaxID=35833 RepID=UPI001D0A4D1F|nr:inorganic phosphate transporter [Bilophila wadsworthia]MBS1377446.1 inorganic phosphate transporter [Desulfovibrionaceae bacterium]MCB8570660.1 inorganic phosphate transporter [Bilophila wadsworthia]MCC2714467.1 inorganic phosphate transporter [Bilophila wadsworthia]MDU4374099.1 inorganic phosphate transporter [Bilophila wadsworthia]
MFDVSFLLILIIIVALIFDFTNGAHDCANAIATVVSTKVLSPRTAVIMAATLNLIGAFLGTKVANTLGSGIVHPDIVANCQPLVLAALIGAIGWNLFTWHFGIPSSSSHALIGGLMGAAVAYAGFSSLNGGSILTKILLPLVLSPLAGFGMGLLVMFLIMFLCAKCARNKLNTAFTRLQVLSAAFMATSHGMNDAQKTMGVITLALFIFNEIETIAVPLWVKCLCAAFMALGTAMGGWKIVKTMGHKIFKLEPVHGFASETSAALVISGASLLGAPISTTHTITACIFGVGSTKRLTAVRWGVAGHLIIAWVLTIPASGLLAACSFFLLNAVGFA